MWPDETWFKQYVILVVYRSLFILLAPPRFHALPNVCNDSSAMSRESLSKDCEGRLSHTSFSGMHGLGMRPGESVGTHAVGPLAFSLSLLQHFSQLTTLSYSLFVLTSAIRMTPILMHNVRLPCTTHELLPILMHTVPLWFWRMKSMIWGQPQWTAWWRMVAFDRSLVPTSAGRHESHVTHGVLQISPVTTQCKSCMA